MKTYLSLIVLLTISTIIRAQNVNGYCNVTAIAGNTFTVDNADETFDTFEDGDFIVIMQMQDDVIGANITNVATFGDVAAIRSAGLYEIRQILSHTEAVGLPTTITITNSTVNTYYVGTNSSLQIISFPKLGSPNYTTTAAMGCKDWNGTTGGVLAFEVPGILTLAHIVNTSGNGFKGGAVSANFSGTTACEPSNYIVTANHTNYGGKGQGIYKTTTTDLLYARGHLASGGGGGNNHNAGGGGGGNYRQGGFGGGGYLCGTQGSGGGGGYGGTDLSGYIGVNRIFMGGGGGAGQQNNSQGSVGDDGGGIILIKANQITTSCATSLTISSNTAAKVIGLNNDGQGGGGAGGSIVFQVNNWNVAATCPLQIRVNGGNGGTVNSAAAHGGGGGGAQGVIIFSGAKPTTNIITQASNGGPGCNSNVIPCPSFAGNASGANGQGILTNLTGSLPIKLKQFKVECASNNITKFNWVTASEINNNYFTIEASTDLDTWDKLTTQQGANNSITEQLYYFETNITGYNYYRLKQTDYDGNFEYSPIESTSCANSKAISFNTYVVGETTFITFDNLYNDTFLDISIVNSFGQIVTNNKFDVTNKNNLIEPIIANNKVAAGIYYMIIKSDNYNAVKKIIVE